MPRKKKTYGPSVTEGIEIKVVAARKSALKKLQEEYEGDPRKIEAMTLLSPTQFLGRATGENFLREKADSWDNAFCPYVTIRDFEALSTPKIKELRKKISDEVAALAVAIDKADVSRLSSKFAGCPSCESKVNRKYIKGSACPVCGIDLRSDSAKRAIERKEEKLKRVKTALEKEYMKSSGEAPLRYLVVMPAPENK